METVAAASDGLKKYITSLENNVIEFEKRVAELERNNQTLEQENSALQEKLKLALYRQFGRHAERFVGEGQLALFDAGEAAAPTSSEPADERETVKSYNRSKRGRKPIDEHIPRVDAIIDLPEADKQCACGSVLTCIGEDVTERLVMVPEKV
jgi:transposase